MRVAVTGAGGRLGKALVRALGEAPFTGPGGPIAWTRQALDLDAPDSVGELLDGDRVEVVEFGVIVGVRGDLPESMRGAMPIVLATFAASAGIAEAGLIFDVVFFVVLTSALVQGLSAVPVIRALGIAAERTPADVIADALPLEGTGLDVVEVLVPEGSPLHGRALREVPAPDGALVAAVGRGRDVGVPRGGTRPPAGGPPIVPAVGRGLGRKNTPAPGAAKVGPPSRCRPQKGYSRKE